MLHKISSADHGPLGVPMTHAVESCVHCGFCLAACPTYQELGQEMDTPRGRIVLMKEVLEGTLPVAAAQPHIDRCLGCLACEPACPSGVPYRDLISSFRAVTQSQVKRGWMENLRRSMVARTLPYPKRFRWAARIGGFGKRLRAFLPSSMRPMLDLIPDRLPPAQAWPEIVPARGERRARVALLLGCAQQVLDPDINSATIEVLTRNGIEVVIPQAQGCCGGLAWHTGDLQAAQQFAFSNLSAFPLDVDAILTNAAGCGSAMREYQLILRGTAQETAAGLFSARVIDVSAYLFRIGLLNDIFATQKTVVAYQDACHLANAQEIRDEPRELLKCIPGLELRELSNAHLCCGSAGTYNIDQPKIAASLGRQKAQAIIDTDADVVASGNIGCLTQIRMHLQSLNSRIAVRHTMQVLRDALRK